MAGLHLFIDNSNLFIEAQRVAREKFYYDDALVMRMRVSYGGLLEKIRSKRNLNEAVLVGSRPPQNDGLWDQLRKLGISPRIFERNYSNREKSVDAELTNALRDTLEDSPEVGVIALVAGDRDYIPVLERCVKKGWPVEVYFWGQASNAIQRMDGVEFISMDDFFDDVTFLAKKRD